MYKTSQFLRRNIPLNVSALRKKLMFQSIVLSVLLYASCVWSPSVSKIRQLEAFQFRAIKWIYKLTAMFHHSSQLVEENGHHGLSCARSAGPFSRHHNLNTLVKQALSSTKDPSILEPNGLTRSDGKRPEEITLAPGGRK